MHLSGRRQSLPCVRSEPNERTWFTWSAVTWFERVANEVILLGNRVLSFVCLFVRSFIRSFQLLFVCLLKVCYSPN